ncbi:LysR substrate-binding domain-containing protein [Demequina litorisediminis]|uniref:LysR family transcriptional regulator n=1 Tax=Demequina litorisediminis TaxID=1849022 RepID=A0ABQ6IE05_9MICO|nr:LysR substrate-binding domain-containing protein [Demequina litorisediminis]GMA35906.1 LysR family transcriptional regulator [Demequina litorisediminis]
MIDVDRLLLLREVARHGSKAAAARALSLAEPTVAHHLKALERRAGVPLTTRIGRVTRLTPAGEALLEHADAIAASLASAERALAQHADLSGGRLRIAAFTSFCAVALPSPLAQFARRYPGVDVGLVETETDDALALLDAGEVDLVIGFADDATPAPADLPVRMLESDEYLAVLPAGHAAARGRTVEIGALAEDTWISGCQRCRAHLHALAHAGDFVPQIAFQTEDYVTVQRLVAEGLGVALLPRMALAASPDVAGIVTAPTSPTSYREVFLALPRDASAAATAFAALLAP